MSNYHQKSSYIKSANMKKNHYNFNIWDIVIAIVIYFWLMATIYIIYCRLTENKEISEQVSNYRTK
ncbi:hypothetical protein HMPREF9455_01726 [Dysgonomonas gadei ATCC BAA-286]|uniref:Uncharacterized protein n=1 Tax=Dysgonomonas gadei ATCC BAA-286 TaxID=742766 RepID=F5IXA9_9BACT|nr:hypothetical protein HMPREF9455_01726 [Dysgonomonas gadei ATCC BAA-286]